MQFAQDGRFSSHLIRLCLERENSISKCAPSRLFPHSTPSRQKAQSRKGAPYLQLLHPVLTLGLLVLARRGFCAASPELLPAVVEVGVRGAPGPVEIAPDDMTSVSLLSDQVGSSKAQAPAGLMICAVAKPSTNGNTQLGLLRWLRRVENATKSPGHAEKLCLAGRQKMGPVWWCYVPWGMGWDVPGKQREISFVRDWIDLCPSRGLADNQLGASHSSCPELSPQLSCVCPV